MDNLFSVIIPIYNVENYVEECINSVLGQDYKDIEILLINDGSKIILNQFVRKKLKKIRELDL